jgi:DNA-binding NarL/FixJ family response regulator
MGRKDIRVALVEDDKDILLFVRGILEEDDRIVVADTFANGDDFLRVIKDLEVDVVLMDINLPGRNGIECIREAKVIRPNVQYMVLTVFENPAYVFPSLVRGCHRLCGERQGTRRIGRGRA